MVQQAPAVFQSVSPCLPAVQVRTVPESSDINASTVKLHRFITIDGNNSVACDLWSVSV